jgi:hypothetical protein
MKRNFLYVALVLALLFPVAALAADFSSPAELLSSLTGISVQDLYEQHQQDKTFGQIADENDVLAEYQAGQLNLNKVRQSNRPWKIEWKIVMALWEKIGKD